MRCCHTVSDRYLWLVAFFRCFCPAQTAPTIALPINSQLPDIAQVGSEYNFRFSASTFKAQDGGVQYSISGAPAWLRLDGSKRIFSGRPTKDDLGTYSFTLQATDHAGSTSMPVELVVSNNDGPTVGSDAAKQLSKFGSFESPDTLLIYPASPFNVVFSRQSFLNTTSDTQFVAIGGDNTPLPSWISFDPQVLTFIGTTPASTSLEELPQDFEIFLVATDIPGYSRSRIPFHLTVESHTMLFDTAGLTIDTVPGELITFEDLPEHLQVDGKAMPLSEIVSVSADQPEWLQIDKYTLILHGLAPHDAMNSSFWVNVTDKVGDTATARLSINIHPKYDHRNLILGQIGNITITIGSPFNYTFDRSDFASGDLSFSIDAGATASWLQFDNRTLTLSGCSPKDLSPGQDRVAITVTTDHESSSQVVPINLIRSERAGRTQYSTIALSSASALNTATMTATASHPENTWVATSKDQNGTDPRKIALAVLCPVIGIALIALVVLLRRRKIRYSAGSSPASPSRRQRLVEFKHEFYGKLEAIIARKHGKKRKSPDEDSADNTCHAFHNGRQSSPRPRKRPPRPPSAAPQVGRFILDRDPDPFLSSMERQRSIGGIPSDDHAPQVAPETLYEHQGNLARASWASFLPHIRRTRRSMLLLPGHVYSGSTGETHATAQRHRGLDNPVASSENFVIPTEGIHLGQGAAVQGSTLWQVGPPRTSHDLEGISEGPGHPLSELTFQTSTLTNSQLRGEVLNASSAENGNRPRVFAAHTISPSISSNCRDDDGSDRSKVSSRQASLHRSNSNRRSSQLLRVSKSQISSYGISSQLPLHMKRRRQLPPTARFSNSNKSASVSSSSHGGHRMRVESTLHATNGNSIRFPRYSSESSTPRRKRSKAAVERLGRKIHSISSVHSEVSSSLLSAATSGCTENRIRRLFEKSEDRSSSEGRSEGRSEGQARYSLHRLSSLPEIHRGSSQNPALRIQSNEGQYRGAQHASPFLSRSFQGELGESEWETETASAEDRVSTDVSTGGCRSRSLTPGYI